VTVPAAAASRLTRSCSARAFFGGLYAPILAVLFVYENAATLSDTFAQRLAFLATRTIVLARWQAC